MHDFDLFIRFKDITKAKTAVQMANMLGTKSAYISQVKNGDVKLSEKIAHKMWTIAGDEISQMWGRLREQEVKQPREDKK